MRRFWLGLSITRRGAFILLVPTIFTLSSLINWSWSRQQERLASSWVIHTEETLKESNQLLTLLVDAETGVRGYGLTQNPQFLEPYQHALRAIPDRVAMLAQLTENSTSQQLRLAAIRADIETYLSLLEGICQLLDRSLEQSFESAAQLQNLLVQGKAEMDTLRSELDGLQTEEQQLLQSRREQLQRTKQLVDRLLSATVVLSLISYAVAFFLYRQADQVIMERNRDLAIANQSLSQFNVTLARRNQDLNEFTYIVSHDLKAPLRAVNNLSDWIAEDLDVPADSAVGKQIALLQTRVAKMHALIDGLLQYSRADRGENPIESVNVAELVKEVVEALDLPPQFGVQIAPGMPTLKTERLLLQQVFSNLISNSYKHHTRKDGKVTVSAQQVSHSDRYNFSHYEFAVADDGPGIDPEYHEQVFKIFQTLSANNPDSTGIGLSIVKKIVENRGGTLRVASQVGQGTTFYFTWP